MPSFLRDDYGHVKALVDTLGYDLEPSILIGGWASWVHINGEVSADIDTIIASDSVRSTLAECIPDLSSNTVHQGRKLRGTIDGVHIDVYLPFESRLGERLMLRVEVLARFIEQRTYQGWQLLTMEAHLVTKLAALLDRPRSSKGQKDAGEVLAMLKHGVSAEDCVRILMEATAGARQAVPAHIERAFQLLGEIGQPTKRDRRLLGVALEEWRSAAAELLRP